MIPLSLALYLDWLSLKKAKPTLIYMRVGKKIAMKKKINIGLPISFQIYVFIL